MKFLVPFFKQLFMLLTLSAGDRRNSTCESEDARLAQEAKKIEEGRQKRELAHYAATVAAWFNTKMEHDKSLLTLSTAAIGLLITLVTKFSVSSHAAMFVFIGALVSFVLSLVVTRGLNTVVIERFKNRVGRHVAASMSGGESGQLI